MSIDNNEIKYWLAFSQITNIGPVRWQRLLKYFKSMADAWQAPAEQLAAAGLEQKIITSFLNKKNQIDPEAELAKIAAKKIKIITSTETDYPKLLKEIYAPPPLLYYFGDFNLNQDYSLAVVGSRKASGYGKQVTSDLVKDLVAANLTIISGLALGVDACAHQVTIDCQGKTIAVLGSGLDEIYPASNNRLAKKILDHNGGIISEFPLGTRPHPSNFPRRNRIIAGLSLGVLVTEAGDNSGALITARYALEQNREVFAVPGNIYNGNCVGTNQLIKWGAKLVTNANDILESLNLQQIENFSTAKKAIPTTAIEEKLLELITGQPVHIDKLVSYSRLDISALNATLIVMEMKGLIKNFGNNTYAKAR